jgi:hypothetical protein
VCDPAKKQLGHGCHARVTLLVGSCSINLKKYLARQIVQPVGFAELLWLKVLFTDLL